MKIHVYDTHVKTVTGKYLHFDVLVDDSNSVKVKQFAENYLADQGIEAENIELQSCNFCHSEIANPQVQQDITSKGHCIIPL